MDMDDRTVYVRGEITRVFDKEGFMLRDDSGEIHVRFGNHSLREHNFHAGTQVEVRGRVDREHRHDYDLLANSIKLHDDVIIGDF
jgi:uncharacterized protein YdeI (BOF family)